MYAPRLSQLKGVCLEDELGRQEENRSSPTRERDEFRQRRRLSL
jgi:hypothetical protein